MTDLLRPSTQAAAGRPAGGPRSRPLALAAGGAGLVSPLVVLALTWVVGLVGWFASDGGSHGTPRSVLRLGADAWLLAHGTHIETYEATLSATPLGLTLLAAYVTFRTARAAAVSSATDDLRGVGLGVVVLAGTYGTVALLTAVLASTPAVQPSLGLAFLGGLAMAVGAGGPGLLAGSGTLTPLWRSRSNDMRAVLLGAVVTPLLLLVLGAVVVTGALVLRGSDAANVLTELRVDITGAVMSVLLLAAITPNLMLLAVAYLLGPGFAVGTDTIVSPSEVVLGPVPAVPVLAALPSEGAGPGWSWILLGVPVVVAAAAGWMVHRTTPTRSWWHATARAVGGALLGAVLLAAAVATAGGSIGSGRMSDLGAPVLEVLLTAATSFATGGVVGALAATWWRRRRIPEDEDHVDDDAGSENVTRRVDLSTEPTVRIPRLLRRSPD
jgi:hypothetical protein